jgi:DUF4097 and DUF4098 domain-containing protein YvlB
MVNGRFSVFLLVVGILTSPASLSAQSRADSFDWKGQVSAGKTIEIKGVNGGIRAEFASGSQVEVAAKKNWKRNDPAEVEIKVVEHADGTTICAVYPGPAGDALNECMPGSGGRMSVHNNDVRVEFTVKVPAGVRFVGRTVNGGIDANSLPDDIEAYAVNGSIHISGKGPAQAETVNGSIDATLGQGSLAKSMSFKTVNGGINVSAPSSINAEVDIQTVNGSINTDFPLIVQGRFGPKKVNGKIGGGGAGIKMHTVNGSVHLRQTS